MPRVLFLPHALRRTYFHRVLARAREAHDWRIAVVCWAGEAGDYRRVVDSGDDLLFIPAFERVLPGAARETELASLVQACEKQSGIALNRIVLCGERDVGRGFGVGHYHWPEDRLARSVRRDNRLPERIILAMFDWALAVLDRVKPDFVLAGHTGSPLHLVFSLLAQQRGLSCVQGRRSKLLSGRCYWTGDRFMFNDRADEVYRQLEAGDAPGRESLDYIRSFRERPRTVDYIQNNWRQAASRNWFKAHLSFARLFAGQLRQGFGTAGASRRRKPVWSKLKEYYRIRWYSWRHLRTFSTFDREQLAGLRYVYLPLHKEPEIAINYQAWRWHDQRATVALLASMLPAGVSLLVREHRFNLGRRPAGYYGELAALPGVRVIHPYDPQFKYIENAGLVITDNGSSGWEGLLMRVPVITLDRSFYGACGVAEQVSDAGQLAAAIINRLLDGPVTDDSDQRLARLLDAERMTTVDETEPYDDESIAAIEQLAGLPSGQYPGDQPVVER